MSNALCKRGHERTAVNSATNGQCRLCKALTQRLRPKGSHYELDYCPVCEQSFTSTALMSSHMRSNHNRLVIELDLHAAEIARQQRYRQIEREEEELLQELPSSGRQWTARSVFAATRPEAA